MNLTICNAKDVPGSQEKIAELFVDGFYHMLNGFTKDRKRLERAFTGAFDESRVRLALLEGKVVGVLGVSDSVGRPMALDKARFRKSLGFLVGSIAYKVLSKEMVQPYRYGENSCFIDFLSVDSTARRCGAGHALLEDLSGDMRYSSRFLEVGDANAPARKLYEACGFVEAGRREEKYQKQTGFNYFLLMEQAG